MAILHAVRCLTCETIEERFFVEHGDYGTCPECGSIDRTWIPRGFATDVYGSPTYSDATGQVHSSTREKVKCANEAGFSEAGDRVHGGRADHTLKNKVYSGLGLRGGKTSAGERERARGN